jgi:PAS domain S-box-containing protein
MYDIYNELPFGVVILKLPSLVIEFSNKRFWEITGIDGEITGSKLINIDKLSHLHEILIKSDSGESYIRETEIGSGEYYDIVIKKHKDEIILYTHRLKGDKYGTAEEHIHESFQIKDKKVLQAAIDGLPYYVYITDNRGDIIHINSTAKLVLKQDNIPENMNNAYEISKLYEFMTEQDEPVKFNELPFAKVLSGEKIVQNLILKCKRGNESTYISNFSYPIIMGEKVIGCIVACSDVTAEYLRNLKLKEEREQFLSISTELKTKCDIIEILRNREKEHLMHLKDVINNISEGLIVLDNKGNFNFCNKAVYSIIDVSAADLIHYPNVSRKYNIGTLDFPKLGLKELFQLSYKKCEPIRNVILEIEHKESGERKYVEFNSNPIQNQKKDLMYIIVTLKDVTEVKRHELYAEDQANFIKDVVDTMDIPVAVVDYPEMNIKLANKNFDYMAESFSGIKMTSSELINKNIIDIFEKRSASNLYQALLHCGQIAREYTFSPYELVDCSGSKRFYKIKFRPIVDRTGKTGRIHIHALDVTEEINHSMELEKITNLKDEFFTVISHELRTPLTIIYSSLQLASDIYGREITPNIAKTLGRIGQNCSRLLKLINNILDISKAEAGFLTINASNFDIVAVTEFVVNSVNFYARSKGIDLIFDTNEEEAEVSLDRDKYEKILLNLLSNAVKFTPEGRQILVCLTVYDGYINLSVKDEGVGIPEDKLQSIFDRFAQVNSSLSRRAEGTGIGLSLVKKLVEMMDGSISVVSEVEKGSEFIITFNNMCLEADTVDQYSMVDANMNDKINIEFSDVN